MRKTLAAAVATAAALLLSAAGASATHTAYLDAFSSTQAGCQVKGLFVQPANIGPNGSLAPGAYRYAITAINGTTESKSCFAAATGFPPPNNAVVVNWIQPPGGATAYRVYRAAGAGPFQLLTPLPGTAPQNAGYNCGALRCTFVDNGSITPSAGEPAFAPVDLQSGSTADLRIIQRIDYGGADNNSPATNNTDDPFPAALKTDKLRFPAGLVPNPGAAPRCALTGPNSLLGDPAILGSDDPNEDKCPRNTLVGTVTTLSRIPAGQSSTQIVPTPGEIYNGTPKGTEPGRLFIVLRPSCSAGSVAAPGSPACVAAIQGGNQQAKPNQVSKEFLAAIATIVDRGNGVVAVDTDIRDARDDGDLPSKLDVYAPLGQNGAYVDAGDIPVQVRQLTQDLFARADQGTADTADDIPFVVLPTSCGAKVLGTDKTTYQDATVSSATASLTTSGCENVPFAPTIEAKVGGPGQNAADKKPQLTVTVRQAVGEAATKGAVVRLPQSLSPNVPALQIQCTEAQLAASACPESTIKGFASAKTPLLPFALSGPVHLMENPNGLPKLAVLLRGPGVSVRLNADLELSATGLVNTFTNIPEVPLSEFTLAFAGGEAGTLFNAKDLCTGAGGLSATFTGHNGKVVDRTTPLVVDQAGCPSGPYALPSVVGRPGFSGKLSRVRSGRPRLQLTATSGKGRKFRSVRFRMAKGMKIDRKRAKKFLRVFAGGKRIRTKIVVRPGEITVTRRSTKITMIIDRGALRESRTIRRRGRNQRLKFTGLLSLSDGKRFGKSTRLKPSS